MLPSIRKIYTTEVPNGTLKLYAEGGQARAIHTSRGSWWAPDFIADFASFGMSLVPIGKNVEEGPGWTGKRNNKFRAVSSGQYTIKDTTDYKTEPSGWVYVYRGDTYISRTRLGESGTTSPISLQSGDTFSIYYDRELSSSSFSLAVQRIA